MLGEHDQKSDVEVCFIVVQPSSTRNGRLRCHAHSGASFALLPPRSPCDAAVFRLYDVDEDGAISRADLTKLLSMMVGRSMTAEQMASVVTMTMEEADRDGDGRISFEDFERVRCVSASAAADATALNCVDRLLRAQSLSLICG